MMLSRPQFEHGCDTFASRHPQWSWIPGDRPGYGYLTRTRYLRWKSPFDTYCHVDSIDLEEGAVEEEEDIATVQTSELLCLTVHEYIVYSASFNVPAFYFTMQDSNGSPLSLQEIMQTSLFKLKPPDGSETTNYSLTLPSKSFPVISQGEHPTTGLPCWYFHPCESEKAVNEFMQEEELSQWSEARRLGRWMEIWLMIVGSVLNV